MFHFNGTWLDLFYTCFFLLGVIWTGLLLLILFWSILSSLKTRRDNKEARDRVLNMMNPEVRKEKLDSIIADANEKLEEIKQHQEKQNKEAKDGDKK
tara:strand:- start:86 stop:376 length:291 start_codon:yes stop_codon:yes gene_type:complete